MAKTATAKRHLPKRRRFAISMPAHRSRVLHRGQPAFEGYSDKIKASDITEPLLDQAFTLGARLVVENKPANSATIASQITELSPIPDLSVSEYLKKLNPFIRGRDEIGAYVEEVKLASKRRAVLDLAERFQAMARTGRARYRQPAFKRCGAARRRR